ncbi:MAG: ribbon-helix-helix domain-containing protein [Acidobacteria bacterium]|nr:ribbon-helix-helix domain-containing protein [Acidobacteriota bacterium]
MRRTQLYLEDELWQILHNQATRQQTSVSELVRQALRERYLGSLSERKKAMMAFVGIWEDRDDLPATETYIRNLRKGSRLSRLGIK